MTLSSRISGIRYTGQSDFLHPPCVQVPASCKNNAATGRKRAPGGAAGMQQCQNHWQPWHILQCAQSRRSGRKDEQLREKSGKLRCRCGFARTQAFKHAWRGIFCRVRSPGSRAGSRKNCKQNPANCAAAVLSRARAGVSAWVFEHKKENQKVTAEHRLLWLRHGCS